MMYTSEDSIELFVVIAETYDRWATPPKAGISALIIDPRNEATHLALPT